MDLTLSMSRHNGRLDLTFREREIVKLLAEGRTSLNIAKHLSLSKHTIDTHRRNMLKKSGMKNTAELVIYCVEHKLIK